MIIIMKKSKSYLLKKIITFPIGAYQRQLAFLAVVNTIKEVKRLIAESSIFPAVTTFNPAPVINDAPASTVFCIKFLRSLFTNIREMNVVILKFNEQFTL